MGVVIMSETVRTTLEMIVDETQNIAVRRTALEALELLSSGVSETDIFVLSDEQWTNDETALSRQCIEYAETWPEWDAPEDAADIATTLADWIADNSSPPGE
jgi:hypothetical protein